MVDCKCDLFSSQRRKYANNKYISPNLFPITESFEMWCWRRIEKISWNDHVRNEDVLLRVKEQRNILHEIRKQKAN
jgi:hypothetical protein